MRKTKCITLTLLTTLAASLSGCNESEEIKHCVDKDGVVVDENECNNPVASTPHVNGTPFIAPHWYYGGGYTTPLVRGSRPIGGSYSPAPGKAYAPPSVGISRGGFGSAGKGVGVSAGE